jgi:hypothetical protein
MGVRAGDGGRQKWVVSVDGTGPHENQIVAGLGKVIGLVRMGVHRMGFFGVVST